LTVSAEFANSSISVYGPYAHCITVNAQFAIEKITNSLEHDTFRLWDPEGDKKCEERENGEDEERPEPKSLQ
jgi:hypothetical protein